MSKREIESGKAPVALGPYSQAVESAVSRLVFVSGQIGLNPATGELVDDTVGGQTRRCLENVLEIVKEAGGDAGCVVKTTVYLKSLDDFPAMNEVYARCFRSPFPARACVGNCDLPKGALVEIDAIAAL